MSTLTIPNTIASDTYLRSDHLDANFAAIQNYLSGVAGGISSANIASTMQLQNAQLAEARALSFLNVNFVGQVTPPVRPSDVDNLGNNQAIVANYTWSTLLREKCEIVAARMAVTKSDSSVAAGHVMIQAGNITFKTYTYGYELVFDEGKINSYGYASPVPGMSGKIIDAGGRIQAVVTRTTPNVLGVHLQLALAYAHRGY